MIKVYVEYGITISNTGKEYYQYKTFIVDGHAENLNGTAGIKCCAGVTACILGLIRLLDDGDSTYGYEFKNGYFRLSQNDKMANKEINYYLNLLLCQLFDIKQIYPQFFSSFETIRLYKRLRKEKKHGIKN